MHRIATALLSLAVTTTAHAAARFPDPPTVAGWQLELWHVGFDLGASFGTEGDCLDAQASFHEQYGSGTYADCVPVWRYPASRQRELLVDGGPSEREVLP